MINIENVASVCDARPPQGYTGMIWCIRFRECGMQADSFWESNIETPDEHWKH